MLEVLGLCWTPFSFLVHSLVVVYEKSLLEHRFPSNPTTATHLHFFRATRLTVQPHLHVSLTPFFA